MGGPASGLNPELPDDLTFRAVLSKGGIERPENRVGKPLTDMARAGQIREPGNPQPHLPCLHDLLVEAGWIGEASASLSAARG
jgi:hypothetical protein